MKNKTIVSVSLGSSLRNHQAEIELINFRIHIKRIGVDGDKKKFIQILKELDGKVDAFGLGGADLYLRAGRYKYQVVDIAKMVSVLEKTPIVDGGELKETWERKVPQILVEKEKLDLKGKIALFMSGMDRYGLAEGLSQQGCRLLIGDMPFALGIPIPLTRLSTLRFLSILMMPVLRRLPLEILYPTGKNQEVRVSRSPHLFRKADIVAGDFLYINRFMPDDMNGKIVITNTVTNNDIETLRKFGVKILVTTTPEMNGRSFGANVLQAIFVSILEKRPENILPEEYLHLMDILEIQPRVIYL
ncbi:MAG: quinate 5-dehydrogenase [Candidatus Atribacteria bacterium]|nr:quinate 5-dehydrogenase [Candidatus Atribacteria bacterium]